MNTIQIPAIEWAVDTYVAAANDTAATIWDKLDARQAVIVILRTFEEDYEMPPLPRRFYQADNWMDNELDDDMTLCVSCNRLIVIPPNLPVDRKCNYPSCGGECTPLQ